MKQFLRNNSLSLVLFMLFAVFLLGQSIMGFMQYNEEQQSHSSSQIGYIEYLGSGEFIEATFENWESEFLQMASYVLLTVFLRQKGSAESKKLEGSEPVDQEPRATDSPKAPWPVRLGGPALGLYKNSLGIVLALLFLVSFALHALGGAWQTSEENMQHGEPPVGIVEYVSTSKFWFESFQNWQSEYLAVFALVILSIYFRQQGSPESKPVNTPYAETSS